MPIFSKESLETLRQRIDLIDVISPYVDLKKSGASYKGLCPFHDEKTPSFHVQKGDAHYHCFGCGAHGDAIHFLMTFQRLNFSEAVEYLAEKFQVHLDVVEGKSEHKGPSKKLLKEALEKAARFFQFYLLHTPQGREAVDYLSARGIDIDFIRRYQLGLAPVQSGILRKMLHEQRVSDEVIAAAGLIVEKGSGGYRDFFVGRITFPILDPMGLVIGFSARKYKEDTFGGKYVNTSETSVFKKSRILFGLNHSRRRIAKERKALIVEGQIDALRLINEGFNFTVAGQGTAFGEGHVQELLNLGVSQVYLALDPDEAGLEAAAKIGNFFQAEGVEVHVVRLPPGSDPDAFLRQEGADSFAALLEASQPYLQFLIEYRSRSIHVDTPAGKNELVRLLTHQIRNWKHSLMVHESIRKVAQLLQIPEHLLGVGMEFSPNIHMRKTASVGLQAIDPVKILESDFLRWLLHGGAQQSRFVQIAQRNVDPFMLQDPVCRRVYGVLVDRHSQNLPCDMLSLIQEEEEDQELLSGMMEKKVNFDRAEEHFFETVQKILDRHWMEKGEEIKKKIQSGELSDDEAIRFVKEFDALKKSPPKIVEQA